ncbi:MAG: hypothetical protein M1837_006319 [Sclerophora amabilis]|nr:MAG: hypothetical protein M1837_006319 [Sclerophora amabilis]
MPSNAILSDRDTNAPLGSSDVKDGKPTMNSMDYHRQVLQSKINEDSSKPQYISPSDNIMSPCTAKLSAHRNKHFMKAKPQSLFAKASSKNMSDANAQSFTSNKETDSSGDSKASSPGF